MNSHKTIETIFRIKSLEDGWRWNRGVVAWTTVETADGFIKLA